MAYTEIWKEHWVFACSFKWGTEEFCFRFYARLESLHKMKPYLFGLYNLRENSEG